MRCSKGAASADDERRETVSDVAKRQIIPGGFGARSPAHDPPPPSFPTPHHLPLRCYPFPRIHPLNNLPPLILIACLLACFLGVVQSERSLLGGDPSLNYQESTKLFTAQQEALWKSGSSGIGSSFTSFSAALLSLFSAKWAEDDLSPFEGQLLWRSFCTESPRRWFVWVAEKP